MKRLILLYLLFLSCSPSADREHITVSPEGDSIVTKYVQDIRKEYTIVNGKKHGPFNAYYADGKISSSGYFIHGRRNGLYREHAKDGRVINALYYIDDKLEFRLDPSDFNNKSVKTPLFEISIPESWDLKIANRRDTTGFLLSVSKPESDNGFAPNLVVTKIDKYYPDVDKVLEYALSQTSIRLEGFKITSRAKLLIDGKQARMAVYEGKNSGQEMEGILAFIQHNHIYSISCLGSDEKENFHKYRDVFFEVIQSINFY